MASGRTWVVYTVSVREAGCLGLGRTRVVYSILYCTATCMGRLDALASGRTRVVVLE